MFTQGYVREQHSKVSHAARRSYYQWLRSADALDPIQFAAREMSKANSILYYLGVLPQMMSQRARSQKKIPPKPDTHPMTALFLSQGTSKHQLRLNAKIVRFCSKGCKHSAKCAVFLLWFLFFHFFFHLW